ncbi:hypothetical protein A3F37_04485 [Candidatus Saccharibacteria bacterium RIFCSPHIGHO2_12_FULL_41_12]|nr:MAG: hypothetical protein A3F37_04485 [Candidatus Saccharibacteria bacterium RIFCSPHIGHO2_12_FULL_41_12]
MSRTSTPKNLKFDQLLEKLIAIYPNIKFSSANSFSWNYNKKCVSYNKNSEFAVADLLHEIGHAQCDHEGYTSDLSLLSKEIEAWSIAEDIGKRLNISIPKNYIDKCINSYRNWVYKRSLCPKCLQNGIEKFEREYVCTNCYERWQVSSAQESRVYKKSLTK